MIRSREYRLNEVSDLLGFSSQSHFSRCFKQHFGITPKDYAARGGGLIPPEGQIEILIHIFKTAVPGV